jgi:hypothetical protein
MKCPMILAVLWITALYALADSRGLKVAVQTTEGSVLDLYERSYALIVGNGTYIGGWDPLPGALKDTKEIAAALTTRDQFQKAFRRFVLQSGQHENARLLFYYAGHGHTEKMVTGEDLGFLVMVDAPTPERDRFAFDDCSVDMQEVVTQSKRIRARHVLFLFDSCFSGSILNLRDQVVPSAISDVVRQPVRQFITAGRANEPVPDHSVFKQAFIDLLEGRDAELIPDGYVTGEELGLYLKNKVPAYCPSQHPQYGKIRDPRLDKGDFVFLVTRGAAGLQQPMDLPPPKLIPSGRPAVDPEQELWAVVKDSENPEDIQDFLTAFPDGKLAAVANVKLSRLEREHQSAKQEAVLNAAEEPLQSMVRAAADGDANGVIGNFAGSLRRELMQVRRTNQRDWYNINQQIRANAWKSKQGIEVISRHYVSDSKVQITYRLRATGERTTLDCIKEDGQWYVDPRVTTTCR